MRKWNHVILASTARCFSLLAAGRIAQAVNLGTVVERVHLFLLANGVLAFLIHRLPLIMFDDFLGGIFLTRLLLHGGRRTGGHATGHGEQEHGEGYRGHNGHGTSLILNILGVPK